MEILTAYVREHAPLQFGAKTTTTEKRQPEIGSTAPEAEEKTWASQRPATDVQAVLTVLGRRTIGLDTGAPLDLTMTALSGANLKEAHLDGANLFGANLDGQTSKGYI